MTAVDRYLRDEAVLVERRIARLRIILIIVLGVPLTVLGMFTRQSGILEPVAVGGIWLAAAITLDRAAHGGRYAPRLAFVAIIVDTLLLTVVIVVIMVRRGDPLYGVSAVHTYLYFPLVAFAALRQSPRLSLAAGMMSATCYLLLFGVVVVFAPDRVAIADLEPGRISVVRVAIIALALLATAALGAVLSARSQRFVASALDTRSFLFSDLRDFTSFVETHGDAAGSEVIRAYRTIVRAEIARTGGGEVKTEGDSFFVVFDSARQAVACGIGVQQATTQASSPDRPIRVGIGVHAGEPVPHEGQFVGSAVNVAARLAQNAAAGDLLISDIVRGLLRTSDLPPLEERQVTMKGITDPPRAYAVAWRTVP